VKANFNLKIQEVETKVFQLFWLLSNLFGNSKELI